ncbi:choline monooxygenase, putative [Talaromyces stipitatus ATCC 10500]|uniref:Choline monooxygenase, putative n=1 Tax=Talaromyces stipitatus (strain ATCC 10500 / CBS 375.48 / QM 6759 / NRRL 1006) TaxID=441959 RepID=B8MM65_TALSN|nr:choline monooxygenase, putative [Talaromyces stipitatus ATCC 10500]EED13577.1 choline monooxygenase, putative [Talaromyces stipitatus ATCC 10500]
MWQYLGCSSTTTDKEPPRGLPCIIISLRKRRAIFSKRWIFLIHSRRFTQQGDFLSYAVAKLSFFFVQDCDGSINGYHNICRYHAFPIVQARSVSTSILSCKYHGWSYGLRGNLSKAPRFETVSEFEESQHGLFPIYVHTDKIGSSGQVFKQASQTESMSKHGCKILTLLRTTHLITTIVENGLGCELEGGDRELQLSAIIAPLLIHSSVKCWNFLDIVSNPLRDIWNITF